MTCDEYYQKFYNYHHVMVYKTNFKYFFSTEDGYIKYIQDDISTPYMLYMFIKSLE